MYLISLDLMYAVDLCLLDLSHSLTRPLSSLLSRDELQDLCLLHLSIMSLLHMCLLDLCLLDMCILDLSCSALSKATARLPDSPTRLHLLLQHKHKPLSRSMVRDVRVLDCPLQHKHKPLSRSSSLSRTPELSLSHAQNLYATEDFLRPSS